MARTEEIPAGKYAGQYRAALNTSYGRPSGGGPFKFKHVYCGTCEKQYRAHKKACPSCGGDGE